MELYKKNCEVDLILAINKALQKLKKPARISFSQVNDSQSGFKSVFPNDKATIKFLFFVAKTY